MKVFVEREAEDFLEENGFPVAKRAVAENAEKAKLYAKKLGYPITMKVISQSILHKSDVGGVKLDVRYPHEVEKAFFELKKLKGFKGVLIQSYKEGNFVLIGLKEDPVFGHAIAFGTGGIYTEVLKDVTFRICPITEDDADEMIKEIKGYEILKGARGQKPVNFKKLRNLLVKFSQLPKKYPNIKELDINPLILSDSIAEIIDARIIFA